LTGGTGARRTARSSWAAFARISTSVRLTSEQHIGAILMAWAEPTEGGSDPLNNPDLVLPNPKNSREARAGASGNRRYLDGDRAWPTSTDIRPCTGGRSLGFEWASRPA
jgi:hypothetical protein